MIRLRQTFGKGRRRGNAVMEAALVLPILLSLSFGTVEYGYFFYVKHSLQGAAREGARAAIVPTATNADVTTAVNAAMSAAGLSGIGYVTTPSPATVTARPCQGVLGSVTARRPTRCRTGPAPTPRTALR